MNKKFRKKQYFKMILKEKTIFILETYIYPEYRYELSWEQFFDYSELPKSEREDFKIAFKEWYIASNTFSHDKSNRIEIDSSKKMWFGYTQMSYLKRNYPINYEKMLKNFQKDLLQKKYKNYVLISQNDRKRFEEKLFKNVDLQITEYDIQFKS